MRPLGALTALALALLGTLGSALVGADASPRADAPSAAAKVHAAYDQALVPAARPLLESEPLPRVYDIEATVERDGASLTGHAHLRFRNRTGDTLTDLAFHTFMAASCYQGATLTIQRVLVDGVAAGPPKPGCGGAAELIALPVPLPPDALARVDIDFTSTTSATGGYHGLGNTTDGTSVYYGWYPELAQRRDHAWRVHPLAQLCDPTMVEMAHLRVTVRLPTRERVVAGGIALEDSSDGDTRLVRICAPFTRDLVLVISDKLSESHRQVGDTLVQAWSLPADERGTSATLDAACSALSLYSATFGPYPYARLQVVEAPLGEDVGGMESSGLVVIDSSAVHAVTVDEHRGDSMPRFMHAIIVSHEVAHQWWYGMVGSDAWLYPYLDESLAEWTCGWFLERERDSTVANAGWNMHLGEAALPGSLASAADLDAGTYSEAAYAGVIYARGALMYQALREALGDPAFYAFLHRWWSDHRFRAVDESDWKAAVVAALGKERGEAFIAKWLLGTGLTSQDEQQVVKRALEPAGAPAPATAAPVVPSAPSGAPAPDAPASPTPSLPMAPPR